MILRRVIDHVKAQNWTAVALDFVIVVMGVFVGLQVDSWNQGRQNRALEMQYLTRLETELSALLEREKGGVKWNESRIANSDFLLRTIEKGALKDADDEKFASGLYLLGVVNRPRLSWGTVEELRSTGRIALIEDLELKQAINDFENEFRWRLNLINEEIIIAREFRNSVNARFRVIKAETTQGAPLLEYNFNAIVNDAVLVNKIYRLAEYEIFTDNIFKTHLKELEALRDKVAAVIDKKSKSRLAN